MKLSYVLVALAVVSLTVSSQAQVLNKLKGKGEQKASDAIDNLFDGKKKKGATTDSQSTTGQTSQTGEDGNSSTTNGAPGSSGRPSNNSGGGLVSTPPDVKQNLNDAEAAYKKNSYGEARYAVQQAMLGVELEIGNQILKSLPESIGSLSKVKEDDQVTSTGYGWAGLTIVRRYSGPKDQDLRITIANNAGIAAGLNAYMMNAAYAQQNNGQQNMKQTKLKGYKAIIEYDESSGYKLSVPLGQSSLVMYEGVNYASEQELMKAAEAIDIDSIKRQLGEN